MPLATPVSPRITDAFEMARVVHADDVLKGTDLPYLIHLLDVCSIALRHGADEDEAIAALLHDVVEDGGGAPMLDEIGSAFGTRVADIVLACSDSVEVDSTNKPPWWPRKIAYVDHLRGASTDVALVSAADKFCNVRSIVTDLAVEGDAVFDKFRAGRVGTLWYYRRIAEILPSRLADTPRARRLGDSLRGAVDELVTAVPDADTDWEQALATEADTRASMSGH